MHYEPKDIVRPRTTHRLIEQNSEEISRMTQTNKILQTFILFIK
jgi:hypothetical protein